jgi:hypothetical protein
MKMTNLKDYIKLNILPTVKDVSMVMSVNDGAFKVPMNDNPEGRQELINYYMSISEMTNDYSVVNGELKSDKFSLKKIKESNTANYNYMGLVDLQFDEYHNETTNEEIMLVFPNIDGKPSSGAYGDPFMLRVDNDNKYSLYSKFAKLCFHAKVIYTIEFNDGGKFVYRSRKMNEHFDFGLWDLQTSLSAVKFGQMLIDNAKKSYFDKEGHDVDDMLGAVKTSFDAQNKMLKPKITGKTKKYSGGGGVSDLRFYVQVISTKEGKWMDLEDYSDGEEVVTAINEFIEELNEKDGGSREEYEIADWEGDGSDKLFDTYMAESDFDTAINAMNAIKDADYPLAVVMEYQSDMGMQNNDIDEVISSMDDAYIGKWGSFSDFGYDQVKQGVYRPTANEMFVTDTDKRIMSSEEADNMLSDMSHSDIIEKADAETELAEYKEGLENEIEDLESQISVKDQEIEDAEENLRNSDDDTETDQLTDLIESLTEERDELQETLDEKQELLDNAEEFIADKVYDTALSAVYDEFYDRLANDLSGFLDEYGYTDNLVDVSFLSIDYEEVGESLSADYLVIKHEGDMYFFQNYGKGGKVVSLDNDRYSYFVVDTKSKKIKKGATSKEQANEAREKLLEANKGLRLSIYKKSDLKPKTGLEYNMKSDWESKPEKKRKNRVIKGGKKPTISTKSATFKLPNTPTVNKIVNEMEYTAQQLLGAATKPIDNTLIPKLQDLHNRLANEVEARFEFGGAVETDKPTRSGISGFGNWLKRTWRDADFGDGKGKAHFGKMTSARTRVGKMSDQEVINEVNAIYFAENVKYDEPITPITDIDDAREILIRYYDENYSLGGIAMGAAVVVGMTMVVNRYLKSKGKRLKKSGAQWHNDHYQVNKGEAHEVSYEDRKRRIDNLGQAIATKTVTNFKNVKRGKDKKGNTVELNRWDNGKYFVVHNGSGFNHISKEAAETMFVSLTGGMEKKEEGGLVKYQDALYAALQNYCMAEYGETFMEDSVITSGSKESGYQKVHFTLKSGEDKEVELKEIFDAHYKRGGNVNTGRSWHLDRAKHNKSEKYEKPLSERKFKKGGFVFGSQVDKTLVLPFFEFITKSESDVDLTRSRKEHANQSAINYAKENTKSGKVTTKIQRFFDQDATVYWAVRDLMEEIDTDKFEDVLIAFAHIYPKVHKDWQSALEVGLVVKSKEREGNFSDKPYIYRDEMAEKVRDLGINQIDELIPEIIETYKGKKFKRGGSASGKTFKQTEQGDFVISAYGGWGMVTKVSEDGTRNVLFYDKDRKDYFHKTIKPNSTTAYIVTDAMVHSGSGSKIDLNDVFDPEKIKASTVRDMTEEFKRGGNVNTGLSWHLDRAKHNKSERYEKPLSQRKMKHGGEATDFEIGVPVVIHKHKKDWATMEWVTVEQKGEVAERDGVKGVILYPDANYSGRDRLFVVPNWKNVETFNQYTERQKSGKPFELSEPFKDGGEVMHFKVRDAVFVDYMDAVEYCDKNNISWDEIVKTNEYKSGGNISENVKIEVLPIGYHVKINPYYTATVRDLRSFESYLQRKDELWGKEFGQIQYKDKSASKEWISELNRLINQKKSQLEEFGNSKYQVGDMISIYRNQAEREAEVLALSGHEILVEYTMPNGTSALNVIDTTMDEYTGGSAKRNYEPISYSQLRESKKWASKIDKSRLVNNPQKGSKFKEGGKISGMGEYSVAINYQDNKTKKYWRKIWKVVAVSNEEALEKAMNKFESLAASKGKTVSTTDVFKHKDLTSDQFDKLTKSGKVIFEDGGEVQLPNQDKMFHLPLETVVYVPSTQDVDKVISVDEMEKRVQEVKTYLAKLFGGYSSTDKIGGFVDSKGNLVNEEVVQVVSFATQEDFDKHKEELIKKVSYWAKVWGQEAIGLEFEGDLFYVPQEEEVFKRGGSVWISDAVKSMKRKGTLGAFTRQAKRHKMTPAEFAKKVLSNPDDHYYKTRRRAQFVVNANPDLFN